MAFAIKAEEEGFLNISNMFSAAATAEAIHIRNHNNILELLGLETYHPTAGNVVVSSTADNLQAAIDGETFEFEVMYPEFIAAAKGENSLDAVRSFEWAKGAEMTHAKYKKMILSILQTSESDVTTPSTWYVCSSCGDLYYNIEDLFRCPLDQTDISLFIKF
jgi:rubrerythrin